MFWFQVLICLRIISNRIILILNEFRHAWKSYQFVSVWFWTNLDMFENHINCNNFYCIESEQFETYLRIIWIVTIPDFTNNKKTTKRGDCQYWDDIVYGRLLRSILSLRSILRLEFKKYFESSKYFEP